MKRARNATDDAEEDLGEAVLKAPLSGGYALSASRAPDEDVGEVVARGPQNVGHPALAAPVRSSIADLPPAASRLLKAMLPSATLAVLAPRLARPLALDARAPRPRPAKVLPAQVGPAVAVSEPRAAVHAPGSAAAARSARLRRDERGWGVGYDAALVAHARWHRDVFEATLRAAGTVQLPAAASAAADAAAAGVWARRVGAAPDALTLSDSAAAARLEARAQRGWADPTISSRERGRRMRAAAAASAAAASAAVASASAPGVSTGAAGSSAAGEGGAKSADGGVQLPCALPAACDLVSLLQQRTAGALIARCLRAGAAVEAPWEALNMRPVTQGSGGAPTTCARAIVTWLGRRHVTLLLLGDSADVTPKHVTASRAGMTLRIAWPITAQVPETLPWQSGGGDKTVSCIIEL